MMFLTSTSGKVVIVPDNQAPEIAARFRIQYSVCFFSLQACCRYYRTVLHVRIPLHGCESTNSNAILLSNPDSWTIQTLSREELMLYCALKETTIFWGVPRKSKVHSLELCSSTC